MLEKITNIKSDNKVVQFLADLLKAIFLLGILILTIIFFFSPFVRTYLVNSATKLLALTKLKDDKLREKISDLEKQAELSKAKVEDLDKKLQEVKKDDNTNWHLKKK